MQPALLPELRASQSRLTFSRRAAPMRTIGSVSCSDDSKSDLLWAVRNGDCARLAVLSRAAARTPDRARILLYAARGNLKPPQGALIVGLDRLSVSWLQRNIGDLGSVSKGLEGCLSSHSRENLTPGPATSISCRVPFTPAWSAASRSATRASSCSTSTSTPRHPTMAYSPMR